MTDPSSPLPYLIIIGLLFLSAFFSGSEAAYLNCNRYKIKVWADDGNKRAKLASFILDKYDNATIAILIGNNVVNVASSIIATLVVVQMVGGNESLGTVITTVVTTIIVFIFGELLPKNIGKANADKIAVNISFIIIFLMIIFLPISLIFMGIIYTIRKIFKKEKGEEFTDDDFQNVVGKKSEDGIIDEEESEIIIAAVDFGDIIVNDVLTKRDKIVALDINKCNNKYLLKFFQESSFSRIPVYRGSIDNIIGILHVRTFLKEYWHNNKIKALDCLMPCYEVDPKIKLDDMFNGFKEHKTHIAIVKEKGKTIGMITMKDVLEELVKDIDEKGTSDLGGKNE